MVRRATCRQVTAWLLSAVLVAACSSGHGGAGSPSTTGRVAPTSSSSAPAASTSSTTAAAASALASSIWTTYHNSDSRLGVAGVQPSLDPLRMAWRAHLDGAAVYGQPVVVDGRIIVATEDDDVYGLDARDGNVLWKVNIGQPLRNVASASEAGCGNIDPLGITSTPVVDVRSGVVYVVGEVSTDGRGPIHHELVGIDVLTGRQTQDTSADPPLPAGESPINLLQRAALALGSGLVYVGYGGQYGDCGNYHGWVVGIPEAASSGTPVQGASKVSFDTTPESSGGAVWMGGGGPSIDASGDVYITTGNTNSSGPGPWAEAVVKLAPDLTSPPIAAYQDHTAVDDEDLGTGDATLLPNGYVFAVGKTDHGYLLRQSNLTQVTTIRGRVCGSDPDGGAAFDASTDSIYVPCRDGGIQQISLSKDATGWKSGDVNSAPVLVDGALWAVSYPGGNLQALDPATGSTMQSLRVGTSVPNFTSPAAALGLLIVGTTSGVVAFDGPSGSPRT